MRIFLLFILLLLPTAVSAMTISGKITDDNGDPIPYATIVLMDSGKGCASDLNGNYSLSAIKGQYVIKASAIGYNDYKEPINLSSDTILNITLTTNHVSLSNVSIFGESKGQKISHGAFTVNAIELNTKINKLVNISDIVDHTAGIRVRRQGGAGSDFDLSINGLSGNSIRYFIDGIPLDTRGSESNIDNIPLNTVERIELYKGVVPSHLGSDALGGAVNIVTKREQRNFLDVSYGIGSFNTHSADITGQLFIPKTKIFVRPTVSLNYSKNNYTMKGVEIWDEKADKYVIANKRRFHDDYISLFSQIEAGVNNVGWADVFSVNASFSRIDKEIQTGAMQNKVYGEARKKSHSWNISARYAKHWDNLHTRLTFSHTWDYSQTIDTAFRKYSWDGTWLPSSGNELNNRRRSIRNYTRPLTVVSAGIDYDIAPHHTVAINYMLNRMGNKRSDDIDSSFEPTNDAVNKHIISLTYTQSFINDKIQTSYFVKDYINALSIRQSDNTTITGADKIDPNATNNYWGAGLGARYTIKAPLSIKGSYEHSVRLPLSRELLGNGTTVYPNLTLSPESSNNYNVGMFGTVFMPNGDLFTYEANGFIRHVQNYIRAVVSEREGMMQYVNEPAIDIKGVDIEMSYLWHDAFRVRVNGSWNDARNLKKYKSDGNLSATYKNRVPNRPWMFANAEAEYIFRKILNDSDRLSIGCNFQWIHWYYLNWEAYGAAQTKAKIPTQKITGIDLSYSWKDGQYNLTLECNNLFDQPAYDNYMLQKPGRAFYAKFRLFIN